MAGFPPTQYRRPQVPSRPADNTPVAFVRPRPLQPGHPRYPARAKTPRKRAASAPSVPVVPPPTQQPGDATDSSGAGGKFCVIYFTPWDTFVVRRERLSSGVYASCDPVVRLSPKPWAFTLGLAVWRVLRGRPHVSRGAVGKLGMSLRRFAQAVDHARRVELAMSDAGAVLTPCRRNPAGLFTPVVAEAVTAPTSPIALGRAILSLPADAAALVEPAEPEVDRVQIPEDASLLLTRGVTPEDLVESLGVILTPRKGRHVSRQQRDFARRLSLGHQDGWLMATPVESVDAGDESLLPLLEHLSRNGTAMYLAAHAPAGYYAWALASEGRIERAFGVDASNGDVLLDIGQRWQFEPDTSDPRQLTPESVRSMAREWAVDPWGMQFVRLQPGESLRHAA